MNDLNSHEMKRPWTIKERMYLKNNYKQHSDAKRIALELGRSVGYVHSLISKMGIAIPTKIIFTADDEKFLRENVSRLSNRQLAAALGKKLTIVRMKLYELKLQRNIRADRKWTAGEDEILINNYHTKGDAAIARMLPGRTNKGIRKRRFTLSLIRTPDEVNKIIESNKPQISKNWYKPGEHRTIDNNIKQAWVTRRERYHYTTSDMTQEQIIAQLNKRV